MVGNHLVENTIRPNSRKAFVTLVRIAVEHATFAIPKDDIKAIFRQRPYLFYAIHHHADLLTDRIDPNDILAFHAKLPVQHEFFRSHVYECLRIAQLPSRYIACEHFTFWDRKHTLLISVQNMDMRSIVATVLFRIHVQNHA